MRRVSSDEYLVNNCSLVGLDLFPGSSWKRS